ncbi:MAG: hypothetical protein C4548_02445 [Desulfobacteraceae bacterium]|jgi:hypothetical protein|nr:MAG: hypothetical protein C4548_02445 [Desulfobacteraceae bacterium]
MIKYLNIRLPDDPLIKTRLKKKLSEYEKRLEKLKKDCKHNNPDLACNSSPGYKAQIVRRLITVGEVKTPDMAKEIKEEFGTIDFDKFNNAAKVIFDYCRTGGQNVKSGSGF